MSDATKHWTDRSLLEQILIIATICLTIMMIGFSIGVASLRTDRSNLESQVKGLQAEITSLQEQLDQCNITDNITTAIATKPWQRTTTTTVMTTKSSRKPRITTTTTKAHIFPSFRPPPYTPLDQKSANIRDARNNYGRYQKMLPIMPTI